MTLAASLGDGERLALAGAGLLFLNGLLTGAWKYAQIRRSAAALAHPYVDIAHRASLMYSFACLLLAKFAELSPLDNGIELAAVAAQLIFFTASVAIYMLHGWLGDTDNQLRRPHRLGRRHLPTTAIEGFMAMLMLAEIGGCLVLLYGVFIALA